MQSLPLPPSPPPFQRIADHSLSFISRPQPLLTPHDRRITAKAALTHKYFDDLDKTKI